MGMNDTRAIVLKYYHMVKGFFGKDRIEESAYFYIDGFNEDTLSREPDRMVGTVKKVMEDMKKRNDSFAQLDILYESHIRYRIAVDFKWDGKRKKNIFTLMQWQMGAYTFSVCDIASEKKIIQKARDFIESKCTDWEIDFEA